MHGLSDGPRKRACLFFLALRAQRSTAQAPGCENDTKLTATISLNDQNEKKHRGHLNSWPRRPGGGRMSRETPPQPNPAGSRFCSLVCSLLRRPRAPQLVITEQELILGERGAALARRPEGWKSTKHFSDVAGAEKYSPGARMRKRYKIDRCSRHE